MFWTVPLSVIRSFLLYTQQLCMSYRFCWQLVSKLSAKRRNCLKREEFYSKNKFEALVHLVGFIIRIYRDPWSPKCQMCIYYFIEVLINTIIYLTVWSTVMTTYTTYFSIQKPCDSAHTVIVALNSVTQLMFLCRSHVMLYVHHELNLFMLLKPVSWFRRLKEIEIWFNWYAVMQCSTQCRLLDTQVLHIGLLSSWRQVAVYQTVNLIFTAAVVSAGARSSTSPRTSGSHSHGDAASVGAVDLCCCQ